MIGVGIDVGVGIDKFLYGFFEILGKYGDHRVIKFELVTEVFSECEWIIIDSGFDDLYFTVIEFYFEMYSICGCVDSFMYLI